MDENHVLPTGPERLVFENLCSYYRTQEKVGLTKMLPEELVLLEEIEYSLANNLPIEKQKLYEFFPNGFDLEI